MQWTTSVCTGALLLRTAGPQRPQGHDPLIADGLLESLGATYTEGRVAVEGKIIAAAGVSAGIDMTLTLAAKMAGDVAAQATNMRALSRNTASMSVASAPPTVRLPIPGYPSRNTIAVS